MTDWMLWFGLAGLLVVLEMFTGTFYLLMLGVGLAAGGLAAVAGAGGAWQCIAAAAVGALATFALRKSNFGKTRKADAASDPNINLDIGQKLTVERWTTSQDGVSTSRAMYRGALWDIELAAGVPAQPGPFVIREVRGNRLIVADNRVASH